MKAFRILATLGAGLVIIGLGIQTVEYQKEIDKKEHQIQEYKKQIKKLDQKVLETAREKLKVENENQYLWDNYYMNVSNYEGYEYYE